MSKAQQALPISKLDWTERKNELRLTITIDARKKSQVFGYFS
jgi:hypothetical protein